MSQTREQRLFAAAKTMLELAPTGADIAEYLQNTAHPKPEYLAAINAAHEELGQALAAYEGSAVTQGRLA